MSHDPETPLPLVIKSAEVGDQILKSRTDLSYRLFDGVQLHGNVARQSLFPGAIFRNCIIRDCDFSRSDFEGTRFEKCELRNVSFEDTDVRSSRFAECQLTNCTFTGSYFSRNAISGGVMENCHFDRATLLNNEFKACELRNISNKVSTILHTDYIAVSFSNVSLGNCTSLYSYFEDCKFADFEINADSLGLSFGLTEAALQSTKLVFLGREEEIPFTGQLVDSLLEEFARRSWKLHALFTELNFNRLKPFDGWLLLFDFFLKEADLQRVIKSDDVAFVLHTASRLAERQALPLFPAIVAHDRITRIEAKYENDLVISRSLSDIRIGLVNLLTIMETKYIENAQDVAEIALSSSIRAELVFSEKPKVPVVEYLNELSAAALKEHVPAMQIEARGGSWIEILQITGASMFTLYALLYLVEGCLIRLTMIRARFKHLTATKLPKTFLDRTLDPKQDPSRELLEVLASTFSAVVKGAIPLPGKDMGITGSNLGEIRVDYPKSPP